MLADASAASTASKTTSSSTLFSRAIAESSPVSSVYDAARAETVTDLFLAAVGNPAPADLRTLPVDTIVEAGMTVSPSAWKIAVRPCMEATDAKGTNVVQSPAA